MVPKSVQNRSFWLPVWLWFEVCLGRVLEVKLETPGGTYFVSEDLCSEIATFGNPVLAYEREARPEFTFHMH